MQIPTSTDRYYGYFIVLGIFWILSACAWIFWGYQETFIWVNKFRHPFNDQASLYFFTHLADGVILPALMLIWMWRKDPALAVTAVLAVFATGIVVQGLKIFVFDDWMRPSSIFAEQLDIYIHHPKAPTNHSFPSGHATSFATGGLFFSIFLERRVKFISFFIGLLTIFLCYTRVTLGVHFPGDIFVGSALGSLGALAMYKWVYPRFFKRFKFESNVKLQRATPYVVGIAAVALIAQFVNLILRIG